MRTLVFVSTLLLASVALAGQVKDGKSHMLTEQNSQVVIEKSLKADVVVAGGGLSGADSG